MDSALIHPSPALSPALLGSAQNPFRLIKLPLNAMTAATAIQAERALRLIRAGIEPTVPEPLPWLRPANS